MAKKRKTREQKIIADLRRKLSQQSEVGSKKLEAQVSHLPSQSLPSNLPLPTPYLKKDLTKTLTLAILAISLEFVLYFLLG